MSKKYILGIESSCDETSASVIDSDLNIISNIVYSQQKLHSDYFGVVPELASRAHYEKINFVIKKSLKKIPLKKINLISYTNGPGLRGSLLIGKIAAETLGYIHKIPVVGVDHLWGHINSLFLSNKNIKFPFLSLIVSGGHTELSLVISFKKRKVLGNTRDDAVGESFDKVAKMLNLTYPGGPIIEKLSRYGNKNYIFFNRPYMLDSWDFSFSGIKTAVLYHIQDLHRKRIEIDKRLISNICASFQEAICDTLATKLTMACDNLRCDTVCISGGVSANEYLRKYIEKRLNYNKIKTFFPDKNLSTDNAAMIASAGKNIYFSKDC